MYHMSGNELLKETWMLNYSLKASESLYYLRRNVDNKDFFIPLFATLLKNGLWQNILYFFFSWG